MKKILAAIVICCCSAVHAQVRFAPVAGLNLAKYASKIDGKTFKTEMNTGFHVGFIVDIPVSGLVHFMPGMLYTVKGAKYDSYEPLWGEIDFTESLNYAEIPLNIVARDKGAKGLFFNAGPYLAIGLNGKAKAEYNGGKEKATISFGGRSNQYNTVDLGINLGIGYELPIGLFVKTQYGFGLANLAPRGDEDNYLKNRVFSFSLGYFLGGAK